MYHPENVGEPRKDIHLTNIAMNIYLNTPDVGCLVWHGTFLKESFWNSFTNKFSRNQHLPENCKFVCVSVCSTFLVIIAKERLLSTFFCVESLFLKCLFWTLCFFEWKQLLSLREKRVFPKNDVTVTSQVGVTYFKSCVAALRIRGCLHWLICSRVMVVHTTIVAFVGLKGLL